MTIKILGGFDDIEQQTEKLRDLTYTWINR